MTGQHFSFLCKQSWCNFLLRNYLKYVLWELSFFIVSFLFLFEDTIIVIIAIRFYLSSSGLLPELSTHLPWVSALLWNSLNDRLVHSWRLSALLFCLLLLSSFHNCSVSYNLKSWSWDVLMPLHLATLFSLLKPGSVCRAQLPGWHGLPALLGNNEQTINVFESLWTAKRDICSSSKDVSRIKPIKSMSPIYFYPVCKFFHSSICRCFPFFL